MQKHEIITYSFDELSESAKEKAIEDISQNWLDYDWYDCVYEDAKTIAGLMGITIDNIWFSGFSSQGDGACFEGSYSYRKGSVKAVKEYAPNDKVLHGIAQSLADIQKRNFYQLYANVSHSGHYYHSGCTSISMDRSSDNYQAMTDDAEDAITDALREFMGWIYNQLGKEYEYQLSPEVMADNIRANEYQFTETGGFYG